MGSVERSGAAQQKSAAELRQEIERARRELGDTVEALAAKADVKARARREIATLRLRAREGAVAARHRAASAIRDPQNTTKLRATAAGTAAALAATTAYLVHRSRH